MVIIFHSDGNRTVSVKMMTIIFKVQRTLVPVLGSLRDGDDNVLFTEVGIQHHCSIVITFQNHQNSQEEIHHAAGVLDINAFEWKLLNEAKSISPS